MKTKELESVSDKAQNDLALAQTPEKSAGDTPRSQVATGVETEGEGGCYQQRHCSPSSVELLSYIDFIVPKFASAMGMPQYKDAAMDELLQWLVEWQSQSRQLSDELLERVSAGQIKTKKYNGP